MQRIIKYNIFFQIILMSLELWIRVSKIFGYYTPAIWKANFVDSKIYPAWNHAYIQTCRFLTCINCPRQIRSPPRTSVRPYTSGQYGIHLIWYCIHVYCNIVYTKHLVILVDVLPALRLLIINVQWL